MTITSLIKKTFGNNIVVDTKVCLPLVKGGQGDVP